MPPDVEETEEEVIEGEGTGTEEEPVAPNNARGTATGQPVAGAAGGTAGTQVARKPAAIAGITQTGLNERLARAAAAESKRWAQSLGFNTPEEAKAALDAAKVLEEEKKQKKLAEMSELDRAKAELKDKNDELERVRLEVDAAKETVDLERQDRFINTLAAEFVKPKLVSGAAFQFKAHLKTLSDDEADAIKPADVRRFYREFVKDNPEFALGAAAAAAVVDKKKAAAAATTPARRTITTGAPPARRTGAATTRVANVTSGGKTPLPGRTNTMTDAEVKAYAKTQGVNYPGGFGGGSRPAPRR